jgi:hypothetical protein
MWRHDTQQNDIQHNGTCAVMLSVVMLDVVYAECLECALNAVCLECALYAECHYVKCRYAECRYAERRGAIK